MHEFSIAVAVLEVVRRHVPAGSHIESVQVLAGPMRRVDPDAMRFAWEQAVAGTPDAGASLHVSTPPWTLRCQTCGRQWESPELYVACSCGAEVGVPIGGDELMLTGLRVSDPAETPSAELSAGEGSGGT
jgi:hydrogenase nickel incorporation protein HypA/HybF